eukprot:7388077-Prymnesium_polylepis.2
MAGASSSQEIVARGDACSMACSLYFKVLQHIVERVHNRRGASDTSKTAVRAAHDVGGREGVVAARRIGCRRPMKWLAAGCHLSTGVEGGSASAGSKSRSRSRRARAEGGETQRARGQAKTTTPRGGRTSVPSTPAQGRRPSPPPGRLWEMCRIEKNQSLSSTWSGDSKIGGERRRHVQKGPFALAHDGGREGVVAARRIMSTTDEVARGGLPSLTTGV